MEETRRVDLVRVPREEKYYNREDILGRDVASVFPTKAKEETQGGGLDADAVKDMLGARRFISETELETLRTTRGVTADDGAVSVDKPLAEILRERKEAKEAEFQAKWKQMKTGKNRPLDADELEFFDSLAEQEYQRDRAWSQAEAEELEMFRAALRGRGDAEAEPPAAVPLPRPAPAPVKAEPAKPAVKASIAVRVKPKAKPAAATAAPSAATAARQASGGHHGDNDAASAAEPAAKRPRVADGADNGSAAAGAPGSEEGLAGLLGGYSSSGDEEES